MKSLFFIFFLLFFFGCSDSGNQHKVIYSLPDNGEQLLAGEESKTWKLAKRTNDNMRVNMNECTLGFRQTFNRKHKVSDNNEQNSDCGQSIKGSWNLSQDSKGQAYFSITSDHIPKLFNVKEGSKTKYFKIILLTDTMFIYRFQHQLFGKETTIIEDVLIPEYAPDEGRDFHW